MTLRRSVPPLACLALACCVPPAPEPTPAPPSARPAVEPSPAPASVITTPTVASADWIDAPQTPGDWNYGRVDGGSLARFDAASPVFGIGCMAGSSRVVLLRYGAAVSADTPMIVRTETADRTLTARPANDGGSVSAALPPRDPLLDAMAFSKGRFAVEVAGVPALYLPAWPEVTRVIEDCR